MKGIFTYPMIRVSDITTFNKCPRKCYFINHGHDLFSSVSQGFLEGLILKELALRYEYAFDSDDKQIFLNNELSTVDDATIAKSVTDVQPLIGTISSNLSLNTDFYSNEFIQDEPILRSDKFGISGSPDRMLKKNEIMFPSIIKTGNMPDNGIWNSERLALTAYSILVEEKYNSIVEKGFVEYARWGKVRQCVIKRHERRQVLRIRDKIKKIHDGFMPERPEDAPCKYCNFVGICDVKSTLASRFF
jgi:CRISPR-associated exonuclease Cas4